MAYLDNASTTKPFKEVCDIVCETMSENFGNPSSVHKLGTSAGAVITNTAKTLASTIKCKPSEIIFTSGGTESINTAIFSVTSKLAKRGKHIISTEIEHSATINILKELTLRGFEVTLLKPNSDGSINIDDFKNAVREDTILASIMMVNNEVGSVLPVKEMSEMFHEKSKFGFFHIDAIQALGKLPISVQDLGADLMSFSAHKIHGPMGVGALYIKENSNLPPFMYGGGQQGAKRPGTENVAGIAGFGKALELFPKKYSHEHIEMLNKYLDGLLHQYFSDDNFCYNGKSDIKSIVNFSIPGIKSEVALRVLESHDVFVSSGSACTKGKISHVLLGMGIDKKIADSALRISFAYDTTKEDINFLVRALVVVVDMM